MKSERPLILFAILATANTRGAVIFADNFSGLSSTNLIGTAPDTALVADTWTATTNFKADGSIATGAGSATLSFTPTAGNIYELTATIASTNTNADWIGVGFADANATWDGSSPVPGNASRFTGTAIRGTSWVFSSPVANPATFLFQGVGSSGGTGVNGLLPSTALDDPDGTVNISIILNTTAANWATDFYLNNVLYASHTYTGAATIDSVGFSTTGVATGNISNFQLQTIPEPAAAALGGLGILGLLRRRRQ